MIKKTLLLSTLVLTMAGCATAAQGEDTTSTTNEVQEETPVITLSDVEEAQQEWAENIIAIGAASLESHEEAEVKALETLENLYAYDDGQVLFKPTKAAEVPFRGTKDDALSYFVGGDIEEDGGFALEPWTDIRFDNHDTILNGNTAISSGVYYFTSGETNEEVKVEYTFGYIMDEDGDLKIQLHHSSVPFG
ncbi:hypothetical protein [Enterococcus sp. DIV2381]|uniref:hypothetical protein n=1 Tax=unclassified Enterococcus TaxID=2608891 RepID=UPI003D2DC2C5